TGSIARRRTGPSLDDRPTATPSWHPTTPYPAPASACGAASRLRDPFCRSHIETAARQSALWFINALGDLSPGGECTCWHRTSGMDVADDMSYRDIQRCDREAPLVYEAVVHRDLSPYIEKRLQD